MCQYLKTKRKPLPPHLEKIKKDLRKKGNRIKKNLSPAEKELVRQIKEQTERFNKNNVMRTKAYLELYKRQPEIHWAFLGHMVSRNGGWNMTDLKGEILPRLLTKEEIFSFFHFLERGNWLIFQDAYPQFLLYEESKKRGVGLFYLLPYLNVSFFMEVLWKHFWEERDPYTLAIAQIVNEQSYLEKRVIQNPIYKKKVFSTIEFQLQQLLSMNHILLPYEREGKVKLIGYTLKHFERLHERILLGKKLYTLLFNQIGQLELARKWACEYPHTGSRKDYWPHIFNDVNEELPRKWINRKLHGCHLLPGSPRIYSPKLEHSWKNVEHAEADGGDWYQNWQVIYYLLDSKEKVDGEITNEYCKTLERLELAASTKKAIFFLD